MSFQFTIKKCVVTVDGKKYTKNEISLGDRYMFIHYGKPGKYGLGKIMINMKKPSEQVSKIEYNDTNHVLKFKWRGLWEDEDTGKESKKTLDFKIEFNRSVDGERVYSVLIKKLPLKKGRHTRRNPVRTKRVINRIKSKKKGRKGPEESATKFPVGTEKRGNDGNMWVINASKKGIQRWVKK